MLKRVRRRSGPHGSSCGVEEETDLLKTDGAIKYRGVLQRKNIYDAPKEKPTAQNENINIDTQNESQSDSPTPPLFCWRRRWLRCRGSQQRLKRTMFLGLFVGRHISH